LSLRRSRPVGHNDSTRDDSIHRAFPLENSAFSELDRSSKPIRWFRICEWILIALLAAQMGLRTVPRAWHTLNTDFPNYYLTARLTREHYDTSRVYEWIWLQRQKDHRDIDQRLVGMVPITPFSTLAVYPFASMSALSAKHCWLILNFFLLVAALALLRALTTLSWRRLLLVTTLSSPLRVNILFGQYYILLLFLLTLACWLYVRQRRVLTGFVIGLATGLKIFPVIYLLYFIRKKDWKALVGGLITILGIGLISILTFGWELHRTYLFQVLPAVLRGEGLDPYNLQAASLSSLLHRLFIYEPQLNPHPAMNAAWLFAVLHPLLQMAIMATALLLVTPNDLAPRRIRIEWAAILIASLVISTSPGSYLFTILILPTCLVWKTLEEDTPLWVATLLTLYVAAGYLSGRSHGGEGWNALLAVPRLYILILLCILTYIVLARQQSIKGLRHGSTLWILGLSAVLALNIAVNLQHQQGLFADYQWRIPYPPQAFMAEDPATQNNAVMSIAMLPDGYHSAVSSNNDTQFSASSHDDYLAITASNREHWVEKTARDSMIVSTLEGRSSIQRAESPAASFDGRWLAFLREDHGQTRIWIHALDQPDKADRALTPPGLNVLEMSFMPEEKLVFSAVSDGHSSLFSVDQTGDMTLLDVKETRYPSTSPDGRWLAYSQLEHGNWNLWLRNLSTGQTNRITKAACNNTEPTWTADSQSMVYASDCGRGLRFSALCRRRIIR
jgi:hypothetical protein